MRKIIRVLFIVLNISCANNKEGPKNVEFYKEGNVYVIKYYDIEKKIIKEESLVIEGQQLVARTERYVINDSLNVNIEKQYFSNNKTKMLWIYLNDNIPILFNLYYKNGNKFIEEDFIRDKTRKWYKDGRLERENSNIDGKFVEYYKNGRKKLEGYMKMYKEEGKWVYYDTNSNIEKIKIYKEGELIYQQIFTKDK